MFRRRADPVWVMEYYHDGGWREGMVGYASTLLRLGRYMRADGKRTRVRWRYTDKFTEVRDAGKLDG